MFTPEQLQIRKIIESFKTDPLNNTLSIINKSNLNYPNLNHYPVYHNLSGMVNLRLQKYCKIRQNFLFSLQEKRSIQIHTCFFSRSF